ncbi:hypothetical protein T03_5346 [Trichinella britovi]|uniref:Uncharacterized protein n=1 Tax=Trichinella britovi TaxID=45882 RepID=A0A0V1D6C6_TRIBR|nr:hypothetical protein T03_5346 [Trichinella britovi]
MLLGSRTLLGGYKTACVSFLFPFPLLKSHYVQRLLQYLGKYAFMQLSEVFVKISQFCVIFLCFWQVDFSSFSGHLE